ncbi:unnamed protein product [Leptidea sinapis]|uniref:Kazal-like domain-containing protein n=1 Tax=Leptidea sinapis TaxID=189913 RepID=A0A5E4PUQ5_9NEOP|nr:unnamed protein product [Leptidea sinapis]
MDQLLTAFCYVLSFIILLLSHVGHEIFTNSNMLKTMKKEHYLFEKAFKISQYFPVCATNGQTYPNRCALNCDKLKANIDFEYNGVCGQKRDSRQVPGICVCTREGRPVCGTNGVTYGNPCMLNCARESNESLHILHPGQC